MLNSIINSITSIPQKIVDLIGDLLKLLFIPDEEFFNERFDILKESLESRLSIESYKSLMQSIQTASAGEMPNIEAEIFGHTYTIVDFSIFAKYKPTFNGWVRGATFFFLLYYNINQIYKLIRGGSLSEALGMKSSEKGGSNK